MLAAWRNTLVGIRWYFLKTSIASWLRDPIANRQVGATTIERFSRDDDRDVQREESYSWDSRDRVLHFAWWNHAARWLDLRAVRHNSKLGLSNECARWDRALATWTPNVRLSRGWQLNLQARASLWPRLFPVYRYHGRRSILVVPTVSLARDRKLTLCTFGWIYGDSTYCNCIDSSSVIDLKKKREFRSTSGRQSKNG